MCDSSDNTPHKGIEHAGHDDEHKTWSRRSFLQALGIAGSGSMLMGSNMLSASAPSPLSAAISAAETDNILVLVRLSGGNDGLSTVIPINQYDLYANARPNIYIPESKVLKITDDYGIPTYMGALQPMWNEGQFKAVHGVGYDNQNLSHFTGTDIFSNTDLNTTGFNGTNTGWLGRHFEEEHPDYLMNPPAAPAAVQIGNFGVTDGAYYGFDAPELNDCMYGDQLKFLRGVANTTEKYSQIIYNAYQSARNEVEYQDNSFAKQMALIARLIKGNLGSKVYMVTLSGFDTHGNQPLQHERLMTYLSVALDNFYQDIAFTQQDDKVLSMTFSEFGRRIYENGSNGTDHGKAAPTLFFGSGLNGSAFVGDHPSLSNPDGRGNLDKTTDFRDLYATVMAEWLCIPIADVEKYLLGHPYNPINLGFNCSGVDFPAIAYSNSVTETPTRAAATEMQATSPNPAPILGDAVVHNPFYPTDDNPHIFLQLPFSAHVDIKLYNIMGQQVGTVFNEMVMEGSREISIRENIRHNLPTGKYIYRILVKDQKMSKSVLVA